MLVLTRRSKDKIVFPQVGITIHFIRVQSGQVKVGVDAPRDIRVVREEINSTEQQLAISQQRLSRLPRDIRHGIRNELHQVSVGLHLYKELLSASLETEANEVFEDIQAALQRLDETEALNSANQEMPSRPSGTVVLVEDQSNEREMLAEILRLNNVSVVTLADGQQAINYFQDNPAPAYLLIDMQMPQCDGATAITTLRDEGRLDETHVFAVSGSSPESYGIPFGSEGVDRWFPKPLNPTSLLDAIDVAS
jgi:carbon storage regulator CsrA